MSNTEAQTANTNAPTYVVNNERKVGRKIYTTKIGVAWERTHDKGINIHLDCIPLSGKIVLRLVPEATSETPSENE